MLTAFDASQYGAAVSQSLAEDRISELGPGAPNSSAFAGLSSVSKEHLFEGQAIQDSMMADCCISALWLYHDFLDESHTISQSIPSVDGSYWHGIMHRREPDYSNAKYWFRKVGRHAIFGPLLQQTAALLQQGSPSPEISKLVSRGDWDAFAFVDVCSMYYRRGDENEALCRQIQRLEWNILFDYCYQKAIGN